MAAHNEAGEKGEQLAAQFLRDKGYQIVERNWRFGKAEVDIIARTGDTLCFVEVKLRTNTWAGEPYVFVGRQKQRLIIGAANRYIQRFGAENDEARFDVISIVHNEQYSRIDHLENAFYPML